MRAETRDHEKRGRYTQRKIPNVNRRIDKKSEVERKKSELDMDLNLLELEYRDESSNDADVKCDLVDLEKESSSERRQ